MARRRVTGAATISRMLRTVADEVSLPIQTELHRAGNEMQRRMKGRAPSRTGATRSAISYRVYPKTLRLVVGLIGTKRSRNPLFYVRIQDLGRKAQTVQVRRSRRGVVSSYAMNVRAMAAKRFITGGMPDLRRLLRANLKGIWRRALGRVSRSGG
jgi:hypothetical protein